MKWFVHAVIIGLVGGVLNEVTDLHKVWCFLIGVGAFFLFVFIKSIFITARIMRQNKGKSEIWIDQNNNVVNVNDHD